MRRKLVWVVVSCWMVAALVLASCTSPSPAEPTPVTPAQPTTPAPKEEPVQKEPVAPTAGPETINWRGTKSDGTVVEKVLEKPKYGGVITIGQTTDALYWDDASPVTVGGLSQWQRNPVQELIMTRDWTKGPAGTGDWTGNHNLAPDFANDGSLIAESWDLTQDEGGDILTFHIRKGVYFQDVPPLNGRQMTTADVVFSARRNWEIGYGARAVRYLRYGMDRAGIEKSIYVSPDDPWAMVVESLPDTWGDITMHMSHSAVTHVIGPELVAPDYLKPVTDWTRTVGTGPFILTDYTPASSLTYVRNSNYWMKDPFFPENQLPYAEGLKILIIPDSSTRLAALRTGKVDTTTDPLSRDDAVTLMGTNPELESVRYLGTGFNLAWNMRAPQQPWADVRVRQAMMMAVDQQKIADTFYSGEAEVFKYPVVPIAEYKHMYLPLEKMSPLVQDMYGYHPDKAKQLLTEAGYPDGFKTKVLVWNNAQSDMYSIIKDYWAAVGVDLDIDVREFGTWTSMRVQRTYPEDTNVDNGFLYAFLSRQTATRTGSRVNYGDISDQYVDEMYHLMLKNWDLIKIGKLWVTPGTVVPGKTMAEYMAEQAWFLDLPAPYVYLFWQPWLKNYGGVNSVTFGDNPAWVGYSWIDQAMKKSMGQ